MRIVQILAFGVFAAVLVACGAWALAWFGTSPEPSNAIQAAPEPKSPKSTVELEVAPERPSSGEIPAGPERKSASATIRLNSNPQGADATASLGSGCRTPCSIELSADGPFSVTFTRKGFVPSTIPVQIEPAQAGGLDAKFAPDPIFATLQPLPAPEAKTKPARSVARHAAPPKDAQEPTPRDGLLSRSWKYLDQKRQDWQKELGRLIHIDAFRQRISSSRRSVSSEQSICGFEADHKPLQRSSRPLDCCWERPRVSVRSANSNSHSFAEP